MKYERDSIVSSLSKLKSEGFDYLVKITAVDYANHINVIYMVRNLDTSKSILLEVTLDLSDLWVPTAMNVHQSADWYERELSEMFGISIKGRNAQRLLLEKWDGDDPPLRKRFAWSAPYKTIDD